VSATARLDLPSLEGRASLREQVAEALRAALVSGGMKPGVTFSVPALAERFGVSATPVREAMLDLVRDGMVEPVPNKGFRVLPVSDTELDEVTHLRVLLEAPTVASLSGRLGQEQAGELLALAERVCGFAKTQELEAYVSADHRLHLALLALAGNGRLVDLVARLRARTRLYGLGYLTPEQLVRSCTEHQEIIEALVMGHPPDEVERLVGRHIGHARGMWAGTIPP